MMRGQTVTSGRRIGLAVAAAGAIGTLAGLAWMPTSAPASPAQAPAAAPCAVETDKVAAPGTLVLGETVDVTLTVSSRCLAEMPLHLVLVLDGSSSMAGRPTQDLKAAAIQLVEKLDLENNPARRVGVVRFNSAAAKLCDLTNDASAVVSCIGRIGAAGGSAVDLGIKEAVKVLKSGRPVPDSPDGREVMIVMAHGDDNTNCSRVPAAANQAKAEGVLLVTSCLGLGCDFHCMQEAATMQRWYFAAVTSSNWGRIVDQIHGDLVTIALWNLKVVDTLPANVRYVPKSAVPEPISISDSGDRLEWETWNVPADGITFTLKVQPLEVGHQPTNAGATGEAVGLTGDASTLNFPVPMVTVNEVSPTATPSAEPPPPTGTPSAPPTTLPAAKRIYLPKMDRS